MLLCFAWIFCSWFCFQAIFRLLIVLWSYLLFESPFSICITFVCCRWRIPLLLLLSSFWWLIYCRWLVLSFFIVIFYCHQFCCCFCDIFSFWCWCCIMFVHHSCYSDTDCHLYLCYPVLLSSCWLWCTPVHVGVVCAMLFLNGLLKMVSEWKLIILIGEVVCCAVWMYHFFAMSFEERGNW